MFTIIRIKSCLLESQVFRNQIIILMICYNVQMSPTSLLKLLKNLKWSKSHCLRIYFQIYILHSWVHLLCLAFWLLTKQMLSKKNMPENYLNQAEFLINLFFEKSQSSYPWGEKKTNCLRFADSANHGPEEICFP